MRSRESHVHGSVEVAVVEDERQFTTTSCLNESSASHWGAEDAKNARLQDANQSNWYDRRLPFPADGCRMVIILRLMNGGR